MQVLPLLGKLSRWRMPEASRRHIPAVLAGALLPLAIVAGGCSRGSHRMSPDLRQLYQTLDGEIERSDTFQRQKELHISDLIQSLGHASSPRESMQYTDELINEYESFIADSAIHYTEVGIRLADRLDDSTARQRLLIKKADIHAHAGQFTDAMDIIARIDPSTLPSSLLEDYYATCSTLYQFLCESSEGSSASAGYERKRELYADSLRGIVTEGSYYYGVFCVTAMARSGERAKAIEQLKKYLARYRSGDRRYSVMASILADLYKQQGDKVEARRYIALSAISDVRGVIKENMSFRENASNAFADGDVERANRYLKKSFEDANFFSARMRKDQSSRILPDIDSAYSEMQRRYNRQQKVFVIAVGILAAVLLAMVIYMLVQKRRLHRAHAESRRINHELRSLSAQLREANLKLESQNTHLADSNRIMEQYAGLFMDACASAINTLMKYHSSLKVLVNQNGSNAKIIKKLESSEVTDAIVKDFYSKFDEAILNIYPTFVEKVNALLRPEEVIKVKRDEQLNTELRVLALLRIGITDTSKMAEFLRCSITTVYTYRSKLRKRALSPSSFEEDVRSIEA